MKTAQPLNFDSSVAVLFFDALFFLNFRRITLFKFQ